MSFQSILLDRVDSDIAIELSEAPAFFTDLHLDQIVEAVTKDWKEYDLAPLFHAPLRDLDSVTYRQEVFRDLEDSVLMKEIRVFSTQMRVMRECLEQAEKFEHYNYTRQRCFLEAAETYCAAVERLAQWLITLDLKSRGLRGFGAYLTEYVRSNSFRRVATQAHKLKSELSAIRYTVLIKNGGITVGNCKWEADYSATIEETFRKFRQDGSQDFWVELRKWSGMNHIEAQIQRRVALLYPDTFGSLDAFCHEQADFLDGTVSRFDREIQFYIAYLTYIDKLRQSGLSFCQPQLSATSKKVCACQAFDLALAGKLISARGIIIPNDLLLDGPERVLVVTGPNQGGKTTFARMFGQMHYLAGLGCLVPGKEAHLLLCDKIFTHFERGEDISNLRGKLQDDLIRIRQILDEASPSSLLVINEVFSSTALKDAVDLSRRIMEKISALDVISVWVTFIDELASFNQKTVSVVSQVDSVDPTIRTYKLERKPADGLAFALAIAQKHRVTYRCLKERIGA
jgi:DNA mismatch repair protein MutS